MREILVDQARRKGRAKHGAGLKRVEVGEIAIPRELPVQDIVAVHEALTRLEEEDPRKGQIVNLRYFAFVGVKPSAPRARSPKAVIEGAELDFGEAQPLESTGVHRCS